jgi:hypothetical protein
MNILVGGGAQQRWVVFPLLVFAWSRAAVFSFSWMSMRLAPELRIEGGVREVLLKHYPALDGLCRWDCGWYERVARLGYTTYLETNFWPLYPLLSRSLSEVTGIHLHFALIIVPQIASVGAYVLIYRIFLVQAGEAAARPALLMLAAYPFAFFHAAAYPEALMVFFSALALWLAMRGEHLSAGLALGFGVLARHATVFFGAGLLAAQVQQRGGDARRLVLNWSVLGLMLPFLLPAGYAAFQWQQFGDPLAFWTARQQGWGEPAWWSAWDVIRLGVPETRYYLYMLFGALPAIGAAALLKRQEWLPLAAAAIAVTVGVWATGVAGLGRYSAGCWPAFLPLGVWLSARPGLQAPVVATLGLFQGLFFFLYIHHYPIN